MNEKFIQEAMENVRSRRSVEIATKTKTEDKILQKVQELELGDRFVKWHFLLTKSANYLDYIKEMMDNYFDVDEVDELQEQYNKLYDFISDILPLRRFPFFRHLMLPEQLR